MNERYRLLSDDVVAGVGGDGVAGGGTAGGGGAAGGGVGARMNGRHRSLLPAGNGLGVVALVLLLALGLVLTGCGGGKASKPKDVPIGLIDKSKIKVDDDLRELFAKGVALMKQGNYPQAIEVMKQIIEEDQRLPGPVTNLGIIYLKMKDEEKAVEYLKRAITMDPTQAAAYNNLAVLHREKGEFAEARGLYEQAITNSPEYLLSYYNLGVLCDIYLRDAQCAYDNFVLFNEKSEPKDPLVENWLDELERR